MRCLALSNKGKRLKKSMCRLNILHAIKGRCQNEFLGSQLVFRSVIRLLELEVMQGLTKDVEGTLFIFF